MTILHSSLNIIVSLKKLVLRGKCVSGSPKLFYHYIKNLFEPTHIEVLSILVQKLV